MDDFREAIGVWAAVGVLALGTILCLIFTPGEWAAWLIIALFCLVFYGALRD